MHHFSISVGTINYYSRFMRKTDIAKLDTLSRVIYTLRTNLELFQSFKPLKDRYTELSNMVQELEATRTQLGYTSEGLTAEKLENFSTMVKQAMSIAKVAMVWAKSKNDQVLMEVLDLEISDFSRAKEAEAISMAERVEESLRPHLEELEDYNITVSKLNDLKNSVLYFRALKLKPKIHLNETMVLNRQFKQDVKKAMLLAEDIESLVIGEFNEKAPTFVDLMMASMRIYDIASRSTKIKLIISDEQGKPLSNADCDLLELDGEEQLTNTAGLAEISGIRSGIYTLEIRKEGFQSERTQVNIKRGQQLALNFQLTLNS